VICPKCHHVFSGKVNAETKVTILRLLKQGASVRDIEAILAKDNISVNYSTIFRIGKKYLK
jgi:transposase-like protein